MVCGRLVAGGQHLGGAAPGGGEQQPSERPWQGEGSRRHWDMGLYMDTALLTLP